jgi:lon-related putative ATP-dependent protease
VALFVVGGLIADLVEQYRDVPGIVAHLEALQKDILENIEVFKRGAGGGEDGPSPEQALLGPRDPFRRWEVNVFVDNGKREGAPVVVELNPSYSNLLGRVDRESSFGTVYTDFTMIKAGSIHLANGGYLVLRVEDVLRNLGSWDGLKRALRTREIKLEELAERLGLASFKSLRPEPIPLEIKVVLVGPPLLYHLLHGLDEEFPELFKVKADFDTRMARNDANVQALLGFLGTLCRKESLAHLDAGAAAKVLDHAARLAEDQEKLSTHFGAIADVLREASYWAREAGAERVGAEHVQRALDEKVYRSSLIQERLQEWMAQGTLLVDTAGAVVGQVNGLSVLSLGDYAFGRPTRITASVGPGAEGVVDIEREVELSGPIHSKGVMILSGYLLRKFGAEVPLSLECRIVFEQSYEEVEGDSASSAELYAILSALSGLPIRQDVAVTGSVNQVGEVQAVGGVNEKVEGFFDLCRMRGLTGDQGVIIPASNVRNLMLREDVVEAVRAGRFHLWSVRTVDEGIELLTGTAAGERGPDGRFADGSVNDLVELRLREFAHTLKEMGKTAPPGQRRLFR